MTRKIINNSSTHEKKSYMFIALLAMLNCSITFLLDSEGRAKVADFGLSTLKLQTSTMTASHSRPVIGAIRWNAPEFFKCGIKASFTTDIYSYGMILWELLTREIPFSDAQDDLTVISWIKDEDEETIPINC